MLLMMVVCYGNGDFVLMLFKVGVELCVVNEQELIVVDFVECGGCDVVVVELCCVIQ